MKIGENRFLWLLALVIVYANGSWLQIDNNIAIKSFLLLLLFGFVLLKGKRGQLTVISPVVFFLLLFPIVSTYVINYSSSMNVVNVVFTSLLLVFFSCLPLSTLHKLLEHYCRIIYALVCIAIPLGIIFLAFPSLLEKTPKVYSSFFDFAGGHWYNLYVYTERSIPDFRVQSIFWEPGAWAYNQMIAFYYLIFVRSEFKKIPFFLLSLLLTLSTSGLVACLICLLPVAKKLSRRMLFFGLAFFLVLIGGVTYIIFTNEILAEILYQNTLGKFASDSISFEDRSTATANAIKIANEHWLFGIGRQDNESFVYVTSCLSEISYQLGYLYTLVYAVVFIQVFRNLGILFALSFCFVLLNSEAYAFFPLNIFLLALGSKIILIKNTWYNSAQQPTLSSV